MGIDMGIELNSNTGSGNIGGSGTLDDIFKDEYAVILLQGRNSFGDMIYSYVKVTLPNIKKLYSTLNSGKDFSPSDFGTIVASGKGKPSEELKKEMEDTYRVDSPQAQTSSSGGGSGVNKYSPISNQKKAWDDF